MATERVPRLVIDEWLTGDGRSEQTCLAASPGAPELQLIEPHGRTSLPARAVAAVMRRYGRELESDVVPDGDAIEIDGGRLQRLRFRAAVDADGRDYLVWHAPQTPPVAALSCHVAAALRHLAGSRGR
jgi:hypothetical protein